MPADLAVVFDIGGVLIEWDPRHLYRKLFHGNASAMEHFLDRICTPEWNAQMDRGKPFSEGVEELAGRFPEYRPLIAAYRDRWEEMVAGAIEPTVSILSQIQKAGYPLFALSNWSAETFPLMRRRFHFLGWFQEIVLSGELGLAKPDPDIFRIFLQRTGLNPGNCLYVDDSSANISAAGLCGFRTIHYQTSEQLRSSLLELGLSIGCS